MDQEVATQVVGLGGSTDFSLIQLFLRADFIVKGVIIILIAASIYSWALIFDKYKLFKKIEKSTRNIPNVKLTDVNHFSAFDIIKFKKLVFTESSIKELEKRY